MNDAMHVTYPVAAESGARALRLHASEEGQMAEFGENQQQHTLHALGRHLKRRGGGSEGVGMWRLEGVKKK